MLPLPYPPQGAVSSSSHTCQAPVGTHISMGSSSGETIVLAQLSPRSCPLLSPASHFHYRMRGLFCPLTGSFALGSCHEQQKGVIFAGVYSGSVAAHTNAHIPTTISSPRLFFKTHMCTEEEGISSFPGRANKAVWTFSPQNSWTGGENFNT